jgi:murein L,D-transpeptidase YafK
MKTIADRLAEYSDVVHERLAPKFEAAGVSYPPKWLVLIGLKQEKTLQVYAADRAERYRFICAYPMQAASGEIGPKLRQGDKQVPEGLYRIASLNPNSRFHLALKVDYPNSFDRARAEEDGRTSLGGAIMIHGNAVSIGCLAMGDPVAEDLFILAARTGLDHIRVILSPLDARSEPMPTPPQNAPAWVAKLYGRIATELRSFPLPPNGIPSDESEEDR